MEEGKHTENLSPANEAKVVKDHPQESDEQGEDNEGLISGELIPKRGCLKGCLTPLAVIFVIILALGVITHAKRTTIREWLIQRIISNTQKRVLIDLPKDVDKKTIETLFGEVKTAFKESKIDEQAMKEAIRDYLDATKDMLSPEQKKPEIDKLLSSLKSAIVVPKE